MVAGTMAIKAFLGRILRIHLSDENVWIIAETNTPIRINGSVSNRILKNMVLKLNMPSGTYSKIGIFFIMSEKRKRMIKRLNSKKTPILNFCSSFFPIFNLL